MYQFIKPFWSQNGCKLFYYNAIVSVYLEISKYIQYTMLGLIRMLLKIIQKNVIILHDSALTTDRLIFSRWHNFLSRVFRIGTTYK